MKIIRDITLDLSRHGVQCTIPVTQHDVGTLRLVIHLRNGSVPVTLEEGDRADLFLDTDLVDPVTVYTENGAYPNCLVYDVSARATSAIGTRTACFQIYKNSNHLQYSPEFAFAVRKDMTNGSSVLSSPQYASVLLAEERASQYAMAASESADHSEQSAENAKQSAQDSAASAQRSKDLIGFWEENPAVRSQKEKGTTTVTLAYPDERTYSFKIEDGKPFTVAKTYASEAEMNEGFATDDVAVGEFVMISTKDVNDEENARLYVKEESSYVYVCDLSGYQGLSVFIRFSANADGTDFTETWREGQEYVGFATGLEAPAEKDSYVWACMNPRVVQTTGYDETVVMSQKTTTQQLSTLSSRISAVDKDVTAIMETHWVSLDTSDSKTPEAYALGGTFKINIGAYYLNQGGYRSYITNLLGTELCELFYFPATGNYTGTQEQIITVEPFEFTLGMKIVEECVDSCYRTIYRQEDAELAKLQKQIDQKTNIYKLGSSLVDEISLDGYEDGCNFSPDESGWYCNETSFSGWRYNDDWTTTNINSEPVEVNDETYQGFYFESGYSYVLYGGGMLKKLVERDENNKITIESLELSNELGENENAVMSQKAVTEKLGNLDNKIIVVKNDLKNTNEKISNIPIEKGTGKNGLQQSYSSNTTKGNNAATFGLGNFSQRGQAFTAGNSNENLSPSGCVVGWNLRTTDLGGYEGTGQIVLGKCNKVIKSDKFYQRAMFGCGESDSKRANSFEVREYTDGHKSILVGDTEIADSQLDALKNILNNGIQGHVSAMSVLKEYTGMPPLEDMQNGCTLKIVVENPTDGTYIEWSFYDETGVSAGFTFDSNYAPDFWEQTLVIPPFDINTAIVENDVNTSGLLVSMINSTPTDVDLVQEIGDSKKAVMSQKAVTEALESIKADHQRIKVTNGMQLPYGLYNFVTDNAVNNEICQTIKYVYCCHDYTEAITVLEDSDWFGDFKIEYVFNYDTSEEGIRFDDADGMRSVYCQKIC